jgi:hypothetical protein
MSFIDSYIDLVKTYTDSPELFIEASAYYLISAVLGEFYTNRAVPRGVQRPNLWIILSSLPGRMRRSTVQNIAYITYKRTIGSTAFDTILEDGSPEGLIDAIKEEITSYTLHSTELGGVLARCKYSQYAQSLFTVWSKLYYGEGGVQHFSQRSDKPSIRILPPDLYVTMLAGLQEPELYFNETMLRQGLLRRLMIVYVPKALNWMDPINQNREKFNVDDAVKTLLLKRKNLKEKGNINVTLDPEAQKIINEYAKENDEQLDILPDPVSLYKQTYWEHVLKISVIRAIDTEPEQGELTVNKQHVDKAMKFVKEYAINIEPEIMKFGMEGERIKSKETDFQLILRLIKSNPKGCVSKFRWSADDTATILGSMVKGDMIEPHKVQHDRSRPYFVYTLFGDLLPDWVKQNEFCMTDEEADVI